jgi:hypothetical protein
MRLPSPLRRQSTVHSHTRALARAARRRRSYRAWWWVVIGAAVVTGWLEPYQIAFLSPTPVPVGGVTVLQYVLLAVFAADMVTSCFVGYYDNVRGGGGVRAMHSLRVWIPL